MARTHLAGLILATVSSLGAGPLRYKGKPYLTYPMPPKSTPDDPLKVVPAFQVPEEPEKFIWKLTAPKHAMGITEVPVFSVNDRGDPSKVGVLPIGTIVQLDKFWAHGKIHFYSVPWQGGLGWISGAFIAPAGFAAPAK